VANITISFVLAYLLAGLSQVMGDLVADPISKPMWALRPTFVMMLLVGMTWFTRPFVEAVHSQQVARNVAFAGLKVTIPTTSEHWFDNVALRALAIAVLARGRAICPALAKPCHATTDMDSCGADRLAFPVKEKRQDPRNKMVQELRAS